MNTATLALIALLETSIIGGNCQGYASIKCENEISIEEFYVDQFNSSTEAAMEIANIISNKGQFKCFYDVQDQGNWCGSRGIFEVSANDGNISHYTLIDAWTWSE